MFVYYLYRYYYYCISMLVNIFLNKTNLISNLHSIVILLLANSRYFGYFLFVSCISIYE